MDEILFIFNLHSQEETESVVYLWTPQDKSPYTEPLKKILPYGKNCVMVAKACIGFHESSKNLQILVRTKNEGVRNIWTAHLKTAIPGFDVANSEGLGVWTHLTDYREVYDRGPLRTIIYYTDHAYLCL